MDWEQDSSWELLGGYFHSYFWLTMQWSPSTSEESSLYVQYSHWHYRINPFLELLGFCDFYNDLPLLVCLQNVWLLRISSLLFFFLLTL